jgi:hypothetical protein
MMRGLDDTEKFGGKGMGRFVPDVGDLQFWRPAQLGGNDSPFEIYTHNRCLRKGPNCYSEKGYALFPIWTGQSDDPQYQHYKIGYQAFETEAEAAKVAVEWNEQLLARKREDRAMNPGSTAMERIATALERIADALERAHGRNDGIR